MQNRLRRMTGCNTWGAFILYSLTSPTQDEEDETILAMPAAPGVNGPSEEKVQEEDGTTTTYILMQENGDPV